MNINTDSTAAVFENTNDLPWQASPLAGVERRMLERDGGEVARATTIVRYAPNSRFDGHVHSAGEEFFVLEGVFSDEHGDYGSGMYVRNPPGSRHAPFSETGCTLLVKLRQFLPGDGETKRIDTTSASWGERSPGGMRVLPLHTFEEERVDLIDFCAGATTGPNPYPGGLEMYVIEGTIEDENGVHPSGTWLRYPAGQSVEFSSPDGALVFRKTGHLGR